MNTLRSKSLSSTRVTATVVILWVLLQSIPITSQWGGGGGGGVGGKYKSVVVAPYIHNALDIITPISFRVATNFKPHFP